MVTIRKVPTVEGVSYHIDDFAGYIEVLRRQGVEPPPASYQIFISNETLNDMALSYVELEEQIALFFRIGPSSGIDYAVTE
jgi:hypothetical protein